MWAVPEKYQVLLNIQFYKTIYSTNQKQNKHTNKKHQASAHCHLREQGSVCVRASLVGRWVNEQMVSVSASVCVCVWMAGLRSGSIERGIHPPHCSLYIYIYIHIYSLSACDKERQNRIINTSSYFAAPHKKAFGKLSYCNASLLRSLLLRP